MAKFVEFLKARRAVLQNLILAVKDLQLSKSGLIFNDCYKRMLHFGPQLLLAELRRTFWPIRGRVTARIIMKKCVICTHANSSFNEPVMAPLPRQRVQPTRPFNVFSIDFAGPLIIRSGIRGRPGKKA